ncbi:MbtH family protein [Actinophytocola sp.]|jgi:MbtH protein|uniref:MbtH family protein n=1 Tax=Actinophytocola sp. TaxID=1872138 RepID=UPI002ED91393
MSEQDDTTRYAVVINDEEQYSIWAVGRECPAGWHEVGVAGTKQTCLDHIDRVWTDMRPLSLRRHMARAAEARS